MAIKAPKGFLIYVLGSYVLLQFAWWAYMLVDLNAEIYGLRFELLNTSGLPATEIQLLKAELDQRLSHRIWMVLGEGSVFMVLLVLGFRAVRNSISKELGFAKQQTNFLLSITHELKSPLAAIKLQLQTLKSRNLERDKQLVLYERALSDTDRLEKLVENLLLVNKADSGHLPLNKTQIDLTEFLRSQVKQSFATAFENGLIDLQLGAEVKVSADEMALQSIVVNLIDNALKYAEGSVVRIAVDSDEDAVIHISDNGPGIPDDEKTRIFDRFYRSGNEQTRKTKGTGLGLYLVKLLVKLHYGNISVSDNRPSGACFTVRLPMAVN